MSAPVIPPALALVLASLSAVSLTAQTPFETADELLAADRAFSASAGESDLLTALASMFADDVIVPAPGGTFLHGRNAVLEALHANPANPGARASWQPLRAGISADGLHGFTFGYLSVDRPDSAPAGFKYMTYWERQPDGWRARAWKRAPHALTEVAADRMEPALPPALVRAQTDPAVVRAHEESLAEAERSFSRDAQSIGLGEAFVRYGREDAVNMGPRESPYLVGAEAIGRAVGEGEPAGSSSVSWGPDEAVIVASSGDLGITFGRIRSNDPAAQDRPPFPFFTIWRRESTDEPWRYVAE